MRSLPPSLLNFLILKCLCARLKVHALISSIIIIPANILIEQLLPLQHHDFTSVEEVFIIAVILTAAS